MSLRRRFRSFFFHQGIAWRRLLGITRKMPVGITLDPLHPPPDPGHPIELCRCGPDGTPERSHHADHQPDCAWLGFMCGTCAGTGWCASCGGDGTSHQVHQRKGGYTVISLGDLASASNPGGPIRKGDLVAMRKQIDKIRENPASVQPDVILSSELLSTDPTGLQRHGFLAVPIEETGFHTGRQRFHLTCMKCKEVVHTGTTAPDLMAAGHECKEAEVFDGKHCEEES